MAIHRMDNDTWLFGSNCFVCEPRNDAGLHIPFDHDDEEHLVFATFTLDQRFSGAPNFIHGGVTLAILDEAQAWATIALAGKFAVTVETTTTFARPVFVGATYRVEGRVSDTTETHIATTGVVLNEKGKPCAESRASFAILSEAQAATALGTDVTEDARGFLR